MHGSRAGKLGCGSADARTSFVAGGLAWQGVNECPESVHLLQSWAMLEHKAGNHGKACLLFEKGMALDPGNPYIAHAWGQLERKRGDYAKARQLYMDSLRLKGPWAQVRARLDMTESFCMSRGRDRVVGDVNRCQTTGWL